LKQTDLSRVRLGRWLGFGRLLEVFLLPFGLAEVGAVEDGTLFKVERKSGLRGIRVETTPIVLNIIV
jgi:hypothetical protein